MASITIETEALHLALDYDRITGYLTWKIPGLRHGAGARAGYVNKVHGYRSIWFGGKLISEHRIIWFYVTGVWPRLIDHINGEKADNRWVNLRQATTAQNIGNARRYKNNTSGYKGVCLYKPNGSWRAEIRLNRKLVFLGYFDTPEKAHAAYASAAVAARGEFARVA